MTLTILVRTRKPPTPSFPEALFHRRTMQWSHSHVPRMCVHVPMLWIWVLEHSRDMRNWPQLPTRCCLPHSAIRKNQRRPERTRCSGQRTKVHVVWTLSNLRLELLRWKSLVGCASDADFDSDDRLCTTLIQVLGGSMSGTVS